MELVLRSLPAEPVEAHVHGFGAFGEIVLFVTPLAAELSICRN